MKTKNRILLGALIFISAFILTSCSSIQSQNKKLSKITPDLTFLDSDTGSLYGFSYVIDNNTNIVYMEYTFPKRYGITVVFNEDGTPMTLEQLLKRYKENDY